MQRDSVSYGPRLRDVILELIPIDREKAIPVQEIYKHVPGQHRQAVHRVLSSLIRWGLIRRECVPEAAVDRLGRSRDQYVYWRDWREQ